MSYFSDHYAALQYPFAVDGVGGLRRAQLGALHAIGAHFSIRGDPALICLPTGVGKTAVLTLTPFLCKAQRALIITPGRLVRNQIAEEVKLLRTPKLINALPGDLPAPRTHELIHRISTPNEWEVLRLFDVVIANPQSISPSLGEVPPPPDDLFDILLFDEAHHTPAQTWRHVIDAFPNGKKIFFTATPYRRDHKEIKAAYIYTYPVRLAYEDKIFGKIRYVPVQPVEGEPSDVSIARATEQTWRADRENNLRHSVMVRTDVKSRADALKKLYDQHTGLRLHVVHSGLTYKTIQKTIQQLRDGKLDGIICVDMMSEGFDFPQLKIAAIHIPHKSLEVTLQFIGRFARTNAEHIGEAKFLAIPSEIQSETTRLYTDKAVWEELIIDLTEERLTAETRIRETLERFDQPIKKELETEELSLYALWPYFHVKIYEITGGIDITQEIRLPPPFTVPFQQSAPELSATVVIGNEQQRPRWTDIDAFSRSEYDLFAIYHDIDAALLFICSSRRSDALYEAIAKQYTGGAHKILPLWKVNRVLRNLEQPDFFSLGMKNTLATSNTESYRNMTGRRTQLAVSKNDGRLFHRGHVFGKGTIDGEPVTIGYSSASKVWSNRNGQLPELIWWCKSIAANLDSDAPVPPHEGLSFLSVGEPLTAFPEEIIAAAWDPRAQRDQPSLTYDRENDARSIPLTEIAISVREITPLRISLAVTADGLDYEFTYTLGAERYFAPLAGADDDLHIEQAEVIGFIDYLNSSPITLYTADFSSIRGAEIFRTDPRTFEPFDVAKIVPIDWQGVNIMREFWPDANPRPEQSIHQRLLTVLRTPAIQILIYDHRTGEVADFITGSTRNGKSVFTFYHVKGSSQPMAGQRVADTYEVCGQVIKSVNYVNDLDGLEQKLKDRIAGGSRLQLGTRANLAALFVNARQRGALFEITLVQPGLTPAISPANQNLLAAADDYVRRANVEKFAVITSVAHPAVIGA
jgi:superfamily II DNA or RNA helicase